MGSLATSEVEQAKIRMEHIKKELAASVPKVKAAEKQNASLISEIDSTRKMIDNLKV
jgi:septal ring factor EnvC (AmiA/AmiB activator)